MLRDLVNSQFCKVNHYTTQETEIYFNYVGKLVPSKFGEVKLMLKEQKEIIKGRLN